MIQRLQSLFLLLASAAATATFFVPLSNFVSEMAYYKFYITGIEHISPNPQELFSVGFVLPLAILFGIIAIMSLGAIFLYKNRPMQIKLSQIGIFLNIITILGILFYYIPEIEKATNVSADYVNAYGIYMPLISLLSLVLANRFIKKDEKLVNSFDRLR